MRYLYLSTLVRTNGDGYLQKHNITFKFKTCPANFNRKILHRKAYVNIKKLIIHAKLK